MSGTNPVATWAPTNFTTQDAATYKASIDGDFAVAQRIVDNFAPRQSSPAAMTITLDAGHVFDGVTLTEVASQATGTITAPAGNPRIDRVVIDRLTGAASVVTGTPAGSPAAPAIPAGKIPVARVLLQTTSTTITNAMITDERDLGRVGLGAAQLPGTTTNDSAAAGNLGEYVSSTISPGSAVALTSLAVANIASITLSAGDWDVWVDAAFKGNASTTVSFLSASIGTVSGGFSGTEGQYAYMAQFGLAPFNFSVVNLNVGPARLSLSAPTTVYFTAAASFGASTLSGFGIIQARRVR